MFDNTYSPDELADCYAAEYYYNHDTLDEVIGQLIGLLEHMELVNLEKKIPFSKIAGIVRVYYKIDKLKSITDNRTVRAGVLIQPLGLCIASEKNQMEVCNEDSIKYSDFEGIN